LQHVIIFPTEISVPYSILSEYENAVKNMLTYLDHKKMGRSRLGWLDSHFHFSFAEYYNPDNLQFGMLRVINDDLIQSGTGFDTHPHKDMEIITYVVDGELTHQDNMKNKRELTRGQVQYMSAGTGVLHSEHNFGDELLRLLQIWILPDRKHYTPNYGDYTFSWTERESKWLHMVAGEKSDFKDVPIKIHADMNILSTSIKAGEQTEFPVGEDRQAYLVLIEGEAEIGCYILSSRDAMEITEENIVIKANEQSHILLLEMRKY
jgi:quercetin 2,3-dioxygenase